jgi:hypothetical protein
MTERKILYSPGYGAGWTSWCYHPDVKRYMLTYQPIIDALERGEKIDSEHPLCKQLERECVEKFGENYTCVLGADQLKVKTVTGRVRIEEYDGVESVIEEGTDEGWM